MSDVISIFKNSTLDQGKTAGENCRSEAVNNLLSILSNVDESELGFKINDEYFLRKADQGCNSENEITPVTSDTLGSTMRKSLRKMIRQVDLHEIIHGGAETLPDERGSRRQSEALAAKKRKSSTPFADASTMSRRGTQVRGSLQYVKRKHSISRSMARTERRDSCNPRASGSRRMSTMVEGNNKKKERSQRESISNRSLRTDSLVPSRICDGVDSSAGFALSPPSWGCAMNPAATKNGTWQKKERTRRKVTSWLAEQLEQMTV